MKARDGIAYAASLLAALTVQVETREGIVQRVRVLGIPVWHREAYERRRARRAARRAARRKS